MGKCWNCGTDVFLKEEETRCSRCKKIVRYWCNNCKHPFDVEDRETKKKVTTCKWCRYYLCPYCTSCSPSCKKYTHSNEVIKILRSIISVDKFDELNLKAKEITEYFEDIKLGKIKTTCNFGVPKTYAKDKIKQILAKIEGFKVTDIFDRAAFEKMQEEVLDKEIGYEFTIRNTKQPGRYGWEERDVFNLCVCLGKLEYKRKQFLNKQGIKIGYDSWTRIEEGQCPFFDIEEIIIKYCPNCKTEYSRKETYCPECTYSKGGKKHEKGSHFELIEKISNNPTCKNLHNFKEDWEDINEDDNSFSEEEIDKATKELEDG